MRKVQSKKVTYIPHSNPSPSKKWIKANCHFAAQSDCLYELLTKININ